MMVRGWGWNEGSCQQGLVELELPIGAKGTCTFTPGPSYVEQKGKESDGA